MATRYALIVCVLLAPSLAGPQAAAPKPAQPPSAFAPASTPLDLGLAGYAKVLCSAVFTSFGASGFGGIYGEVRKAYAKVNERP